MYSSSGCRPDSGPSHCDSGPRSGPESTLAQETGQVQTGGDKCPYLRLLCWKMRFGGPNVRSLMEQERATTPGGASKEPSRGARDEEWRRSATLLLLLRLVFQPSCGSQSHGKVIMRDGGIYLQIRVSVVLHPPLWTTPLSSCSPKDSTHSYSYSGACPGMELLPGLLFPCS